MILFALVYVCLCVCLCMVEVDSLPASCRVSSSIPSALAVLECTLDYRVASKTREGRGAGGKRKKHEDYLTQICTVCTATVCFFFIIVLVVFTHER